MNRTLFITTALILGLIVPLSAAAQNAAGERVIRSWIDTVKLENGSRAEWTFAVSYDADAGEYAKTITDESGVLVRRSVETTSLIGPNDEEIETARAIIFADAELKSLFEHAANPALEGGFILQREEGHPCGPGSRCLQFDMFDVDVAARQVNRIRYVVVNLRDHSLVSRDFNPSTDGNATRFNGNPAPTR